MHRTNLKGVDFSFSASKMCKLSSLGALTKHMGSAALLWELTSVSRAFSPMATLLYAVVTEPNHGLSE